MRVNQVVSCDQCIDELWGGVPPNSALPTLHSYVLQLRRRLRHAPSASAPQDARRILETRGGGYSLVAGDEQLDLKSFLRLAREGRAALHHNDALASDKLSEALDLWHGPGLSDVPHGPLLRNHVLALEEERVTLQQQRIGADLRLGRHHQLLGELRGLSAEHVTQEGLHAQFVLALYRSGRRTQALAVLHGLRQVMRNDFGLDLSPRMHRLHQAVLACDPSISVLAQTDAVLVSEVGRTDLGPRTADAAAV
ncbi:AfsR/SARP family transcriptional regulator [Streptomyces sp. NA04227]|nr:AfsR/SARP family transcriptional regulator [Streptomyces sp. NA04227]